MVVAGNGMVTSLISLASNAAVQTAPAFQLVDFGDINCQLQVSVIKAGSLQCCSIQLKLSYRAENQPQVPTCGVSTAVLYGTHTAGPSRDTPRRLPHPCHELQWLTKRLAHIKINRQSSFISSRESYSS